MLVLNDAMSHEHACIFADSAHHKTSEFAGSLYERAVHEERPVIIDDLEAWPDRTRIEDDLIATARATSSSRRSTTRTRSSAPWSSPRPSPAT